MTDVAFNERLTIMIIPANPQSRCLPSSNLFDKDRSFPYVKVREDEDNRVSGKPGLHLPASMLLFLMRRSSISRVLF